MFPCFRFFLGLLTTHVATKCIKCLFYMQNNIDWLIIVKSVEIISRINWKLKNIIKKASNFVWLPNLDVENLNLCKKRQTKTKDRFLNNLIPLVRNDGSKPFRDLLESNMPYKRAPRGPLSVVTPVQ